MKFKHKNWITPLKKGNWTSTTDGTSWAITVGMSFSMIIFFGLMVTGLGQPTGTAGSIEDYVPMLVDSISSLGVGLFYMIITLLFLVALWFESKNGISSIAVIDLGEPRDWIIWLPVGLLSGMIFIYFMEFTLGSFYAFETITIFGVNIEPIILMLAPVVAIPIVEEFFFGGVMTPTMSEAVGIVPAAVLVSLVWILWHLGTYSNSGEILIALFAFRFVMSFIILYGKSLFPAIVAHCVINFGGTFFVAA